jgi:nucleotide-binding universal stress UspA family protein
VHDACDIGWGAMGQRVQAGLISKGRNALLHGGRRAQNHGVSKQQPLQHLVVGLDGSEGARLAFDWAAAQVGVGRLTAVHAIAPAIEFFAAAAQVNLDPIRAEHDHLLKTTWTESARNRGPELATELIDDDPASALLNTAAAAKADAIIIGHLGQSRWSRHHVGSVASRLLHRCDAPLILTNDTTEPVPLNGTVVVGLSRPADSANAEAGWALALAEERQLAVHFVSVVERPAYIDGNLAFDMSTLHSGISQQLEALASQLRAQHPTIEITTAVREGDVATGLAHEAADTGACLVVVGTPGPGPVVGFFAGSVVRTLPPLLDCPTAAIPAH